MIKRGIFRMCMLGIAAFAMPAMVFAETVDVFFDPNVSQIRFAVEEVKTALESQDFTVEMQPFAQLDDSFTNKKVVIARAADSAVTSALTAQGGSIPGGLGEQAYALRTTTQGPTSFWVLGGDDNGAMYGGLQMAENIRFDGFTGTYNNQESPTILKRGIKLNLPFDEKSPTYSRSNKSTATKMAIPHVWDMTFWTTWFDEMARNRYNVVSVWNNHPFTSLIKMADYPDVAIQNVTGYDGYSKTMSIDNKIVFWRKVMAYAHARGFDFYFYNWNIWTGNASGKYGISDTKAEAATNPATIAYMRKCMSTLFETYPDLDGFGITQGENMSNDEINDSAFLANTYGLGMADYAKLHPERKLTFIHRWHLADFTAIKANFAELMTLPNVTFDMCYKYCKAHMYSTPAPGWMTEAHMGPLRENQLTSWLTIRNDDYYYHNWGDPDFVRAFIDGIPGKGDWFGGFNMGSDGFTPTRTFFSKNSVTQGLLEVQRQWYMFMLWGRLAYNPETSDEVFKKYMALKYPAVSSDELFTAWRKASSGLPKVTELSQKTLIRDNQWWPEACQSGKGFISVAEFSEVIPEKNSTLCSIADSASNRCEGKKSSYVLADEIEADALSALFSMNTMSADANTELGVTINNIKAMSYLTIYYACKIRGATCLKADDTDKAKTAMGTAYVWWMKYTTLMDEMYTGMEMQRNADLPDWHAHDAAALADYTSLGGTETTTGNTFISQYSDLTTSWDTTRPLSNPDKGWYHHMLDNGIDKYLIQDENDLITFPGMDHLYLRLAWAYLEPEEGKFDWSYIDDIVEKYVPKGYKISFRITCKETGPVPGSVPQEINGIRYATPYWVIQAGAKGFERPEFGDGSWTPIWDDPVFLQKLNNFHQAFAEKYDGKPWVRYVDVGSIGEWGEGHTHRSTRIPPTVEKIKTHMDLYLRHYKQTQLIVTDDLLGYGKSKEDQQQLLHYALEQGFSLRDDSPMVKSHVDNNLHLWTVLRPDYFDATYKTKPIVYELQHYGHVKNDGNWLGKNGEDIIPQHGVSGADIFRNSVKVMRPTYIGFHGYLGEWLKDNPDLTTELLNLCGYWYFPKSIHVTECKKGNLSFEMEWLNKGVAPAYATYQLRGKLLPAGNTSGSIDFIVVDAGNRKWMPDQVSTEQYTVNLPENPKAGEYWLALQLFDKKTETPVEMGLKEDLKRGNYYLIQKLSF